MRRQIEEKLYDEKQEKLDKEQEHEQETEMKKQKNLSVRNSLAEILMALNKGEGEDEDWVSFSAKFSL